jgi:hypothetical protein
MQISAPLPPVSALILFAKFRLEIELYTCTLYFFTKPKRKSLTSTTNILPAPNARAKSICITPVGPAPRITTSSPFWKLHFFHALMQHARGSTSDASSNDTLSGSFNMPPLDTFHSGTKKCSARPQGLMLLVW